MKGLEPTRAGDYFYQEAEKLLKSMHQTAFQVRSLYGEEEALRLVCSYGALSALPYSRILEFKKLTLDNDTFENTEKSRFFERRTSKVLY